MFFGYAKFMQDEWPSIELVIDGMGGVEVVLVDDELIKAASKLIYEYRKLNGVKDYNEAEYRRLKRHNNEHTYTFNSEYSFKSMRMHAAQKLKQEINVCKKLLKIRRNVTRHYAKKYDSIFEKITIDLQRKEEVMKRVKEVLDTSEIYELE